MLSNNNIDNEKDVNGWLSNLLTHDDGNLKGLIMDDDIRGQRRANNDTDSNFRQDPSPLNTQNLPGQRQQYGHDNGRLGGGILPIQQQQQQQIKLPHDDGNSPGSVQSLYQPSQYSLNSNAGSASSLLAGATSPGGIREPNTLELMINTNLTGNNS